MVFKNIQAIPRTEFTIITTFLDKPRILRVVGALKIEPGKFLKIRKNRLGVFTKRRWKEKVIKIEAFKSNLK